MGADAERYRWPSCALASAQARMPGSMLTAWNGFATRLCSTRAPALRTCAPILRRMSHSDKLNAMATSCVPNSIIPLDSRILSSHARLCCTREEPSGGLQARPPGLSARGIRCCGLKPLVNLLCGQQDICRNVARLQRPDRRRAERGRSRNQTIGISHRGVTRQPYETRARRPAQGIEIDQAHLGGPVLEHVAIRGRPVLHPELRVHRARRAVAAPASVEIDRLVIRAELEVADRKSTRLNSSHSQIAYA